MLRCRILGVLILGALVCTLSPAFGELRQADPSALSAGLVARYACDGNSRDASRNGHHGQVYDALPTSDRWGRANRAYAFNGENSYIDLPAKAIPATHAFTMAAWVKYGDGHGGYLIHLCSRVLRCEIGMRVLDDRRIVVFDGSGNRTYSESKLKAGKWQHVAVTVDAAQPQKTVFKIYIDGELDHFSVSPYEPHATGTVFAIGSFFGTNRVFKGAMDEIVIYRRALVDDEIQRLLWDMSALATFPELRAERPSENDIQNAWNDLADEDVMLANRAMWRLAVGGEVTVKWLRKELAVPQHENKLTQQSRQRIANLIDQLNANHYAAREKAVQQLMQIGAPARPQLERALRDSASPELRFRARQVLASMNASVLLQRLDPEALRRARVIYALDHIGTDKAAELLALMKQSAKSSLEGRRAAAALDRLSKE